VLVAPWRARGRARTALRAAIALALDFETWRTLTSNGLGDRDAAELMVRLAGSVRP